MEVDWRKSTEEDRRFLFKAVDALCWKLDIDIYEMMNRVYGEPYAISPYFIGNFRRGKGKKGTAQKIMNWLREEHPDYAHSVGKQILGGRYKDIRKININDLDKMNKEELMDALQPSAERRAFMQRDCLNIDRGHVDCDLANYSAGGHDQGNDHYLSKVIAPHADSNLASITDKYSSLFEVLIQEIVRIEYLSPQKKTNNKLKLFEFS